MTNEASFGAVLLRLWPNGDQKVPGLRAGIAATAPAVFAKYGFSPLVIAHVMAQISHECGAGTELVENLNYSAQGLVKTWPSRFPSIAAALPFAHKPEAIANKVYNGRMGNRAGSGDGWLFRGRGGTNTTGHDGYYALAKKMALDLLNDPDQVNKPDLFLECAVVDFILCGCVPYAQRDDLRGETHHLNGGLIGLAERGAWLKRWKSALAAEHGAAIDPPVAQRAAGVLQFGDSNFEVKGLQEALAAKGYACGQDDGDYHEATRAAVAALQLDEGLPATGIADVATKDALASSLGRPIGEARLSATAEDLREAGSRTIAGADRLGLIGKLKAVLGLGTAGGALAGHLGAFDFDGIQSGIDRAHQAYGMIDSVKALLLPILTSPMALPIGLAVGAAGIVVLVEAHRIAGARLDDHRSGANMGR